MLKIDEIKNKHTWDSFIYSQKYEITPFFQLWNWGKVSKNMGLKTMHAGIYDGKKLVGIALVTHVRAKRGNYFHIRHGPLFSKYTSAYFDFFIEYLKKKSLENNISFIRMSPLVKEEAIGPDFFKQKGCIPAPIHRMDAEVCWVLDISKSEEVLLRNMRKSHRYLIRKALTMNIKVLRTKKVLDIKEFTKLYVNLSKRKHFIPHKGIVEEFEVFANDDETILFLAEYEGKIISGAFVSFLKKNAIYRHGASDVSYRNIPASYLIQWKAIKEAKKRGIQLYNFWGISSTDSRNHPWHGPTQFKLGFGGRKEEFIHAYDLPLNYWYFKTYLVEWITKILKGYY